MRVYILILLILGFCLIVSCSDNNRGPEAMISVKVIDEQNEIINDSMVTVGFSSNLDKDKVLKVSGKINNKGIFSAKGKTNGLVGATISKDGYYISTIDYHFNKKSGGRWEPWNPEVTVILRKIETPVPMYARRADLEVPVLNKEIGFDLLEYDWIPPYGQGKHSDILFKATRKWVNEWEFKGSLRIRFPDSFSGIQLVKQDRSFGSKFKLPRFAPNEGYKDQIQKNINAFPGREFDYDYVEDNNYIFRTRSKSNGEKLSSAMYGKLYGDISFGLKGTQTASINFTYYINPDNTRNLEFDPKRNLFTNLKSTESVLLP